MNICVQGYISYFKGGDPKGFPKKITKIIDCQMSNNQANAYIGVVKMEVKKNRDAEASRKINQILFNKEPISKSYYGFKCPFDTQNTRKNEKEKAKQEEKARQDLLNKILKLPKIKELRENEPEIVENINKMNITQLQFLFEKITEPVESIHHSQMKKNKKKKKKKNFLLI